MKEQSNLTHSNTCESTQVHFSQPVDWDFVALSISRSVSALPRARDSSAQPWPPCLAAPRHAARMSRISLPRILSTALGLELARLDDASMAFHLLSSSWLVGPPAHPGHRGTRSPRTENANSVGAVHSVKRPSPGEDRHVPTMRESNDTHPQPSGEWQNAATTQRGRSSQTNPSPPKGGHASATTIRT